ncbi:haloacid dehalogenase superfamily, subfamily IA, variant 3 with third motif having DD or ED/beta-phosphoglucomutase family hydrolase [Nocardioides terrae]|uniref:Beta-phosphoglucomutase n=1 Tax=Nocardioides terrae TaxID=574651 RepID=A0A1I1IWB0_9ACTN|nr:beta-phosphoglucomutase family hydrolase [Nocardioides terrae]SFC40002.1 haloacid dehalogenase superfamily, subfamily IA, variant 3 with third motif having DD or ED/beta-phosphoglucomutase family hydrolase [Nocardioides terrae]
MESVDWNRYAAVLFDLDGVITPTAVVHMAAWSDLFNDYLSEHYPEQAPYTDADYFAHVDGKPRYDGVRDFLVSRGISLPEGSSDDPPDALTVRGLGNRKNDAFNKVLDRDGVEAYPGSVVLLDHLREVGISLGVVSSSANARHVLQAAGLLDRFGTVVDGAVADELGLAGKPAPDTFLHAAEALGAAAADAVVLEDALSGVAAGAAGRFGLVVGVDRGAGRTALVNAGADVVVTDLAQLVPGAHR